MKVRQDGTINRRDDFYLIPENLKQGYARNGEHRTLVANKGELGLSQFNVAAVFIQ